MTTTATATIRAAIYVRISLDRTGAGLGVERQEKECREYAAKMGWTVAEVYVDNDLTASKASVVRPAYERMVRDIEEGVVDAVVSWHVDRLTRQPRELEDVIDLADKYRTQLGTVTGEVDLSHATGRMVARIIGSTAKYESEHKADRQRSWNKQRAEKGLPHMGGPRPYGYLPDRVSIDPREAPHIADAAKRVLAGESLRSVACHMNERGATTVTGKPWSAALLKQVLRTARISGRREVFPGGKTSKGMGEIVAVDCWQPIITPEQSDRLRAMFANPDRQAHTRSTRPTHLLTGILRCGRCGSRMQGLAWERGGKYLYRCPSPGQVYSESCGRLSILMKHAEPIVRDVVLEAIDSADFRDRLYARAEVDPGLAASVTKDEQQLVELASMMAEGTLTMAEWKAARDIVQARVDGTKAKLTRAANADALAVLDGDGDLADRWAALNVSQQRAVLAEVLEEVKVQPVTRRGETFNPKRLEPTFRF